MSEPHVAVFESLVARHRAVVEQTCRSILRDEHRSADAAQETYSRLWRRVAAGTVPVRLGAWLRRAATNCSIDELRRLRPDIEELDQSLADARILGPSDALERSEMEQRYELGLEALSPNQRSIFLLRHEGGLRLAEIARLLHRSPSTIKTQFARACLELQNHLDPFWKEGLE